MLMWDLPKAPGKNQWWAFTLADMSQWEKWEEGDWGGVSF